MIAADGARSSVRRLMGLGFEGRVFQDQFLICDIKMKMERPAERWFWFDPPFNRGRSALLHRQADDVWRLDFQVGDEADRDEEVKPENVARRVRAMLGEDVDFAFEWISLYRFQSRRLQRFRHGRVLFAGDAAHQMSPFGARGGNSGVQDADNLVWKLDLVLRGLAPESAARQLRLPSASRAADENLLNTTRSTDFIAPKSATSRTFRDGALALAETEPFARRLVNSGRLSVGHLLRRLAAQRAGRLRRGRGAGGAPGRRRARCAARRRLAAGSPRRGLHRRLVRPRRARAGGGRARAGRARPARRCLVSQRRRCFTRNGLRPLRRRARAGLLSVPPGRPRGRALAACRAAGAWKPRSIARPPLSS